MGGDAAAAAIANAQLKVLTERHRMVQQTIVVRKRENEAPLKCDENLYDQKMWGSIQMRLLEKNKILAVVRDHLFDLAARAQKTLDRSGAVVVSTVNHSCRITRTRISVLRLPRNANLFAECLRRRHIDVKDLWRQDREATDFFTAAETSSKHLEGVLSWFRGSSRITREPYCIWAYMGIRRVYDGCDPSQTKTCLANHN
ncbi:hypothetical protein C8T65DRAFT_745460 [Cerioporus squamosus]|nr:hypothetical protein C8T65DRAFT_745460 [Cerioporus squamosus]